MYKYITNIFDKEVPVKKQQRTVLRALRDLGGVATSKEIANRTGVNIKGVSLTLGALGKQVKFLGGQKGNVEWKLLK